MVHVRIHVVVSINSLTPFSWQLSFTIPRVLVDFLYLRVQLLTIVFGTLHQNPPVLL